MAAERGNSDIHPEKRGEEVLVSILYPHFTIQRGQASRRKMNPDPLPSLLLFPLIRAAERLTR